MNNAHYWNRKEELSNIARKHTKEMQEQYADEIENCIQSSVVLGSRYSDDSYRKVINNDLAPKMMINSKSKEAPVFKVVKNTTVDELFNTLSDKVVVLNFASYKNPGGMFMNGSSAQEESLCHSSYLYNILSSNAKHISEYYEWNRNNLNKGMYTDRAIYTPNVRFFNKNGESRLADVITCAAPNKSVALRYNNFTADENSQALQKRVEFIQWIIENIDRDIDTFITGAWGCGVFKQDPVETAKYFISTFLAGTLNEVVFAIPDDKTLNAFNSAFKSDNK